MTNTAYISPSNVSVENNMDQANQYANNHTKAESYLWFYWMVKNNKSKENSSSWDYKQQGSSYAPFGNFNYGATGAAMGIPNDVLLRLAGMAQWMAGTSKDEWGNPIWSEPYGDDPADQAAILDGITYAELYGYTSKNMDIDADTLSRIAATLALSKYIKATPESLSDLYNQVYNSNYFSVYGSLHSKCALDNDLKFISTAYQCDLDKSATYRIVYIEPLTLDLDGDGIEAVAETGRSGVMFDTDTDGISTATGWISADDGLLVRDINKNGIIDNGSEFFGDNTQLLNGSKAADGFSALTDLDGNHDGKVDANDSAFTELKIWRDLNQDGISSADELFSLSDLNVASLNVENNDEFISLTGSNYINKTGTYTKSDGKTAVMADVNFVTNNLITEYKDKIAVSEEIAELPNLTGYGRLRSLQEAATLSPALAEILKQYAVATTKDQQMALIDDLVLEWAKTDPQWDAYGTKEYSEGLKYDPNSSNVIYLRRGETYGQVIIEPTPVHRDIYHIADAFFNRKTLSVSFPRNSNPSNNPLMIAERTYTQIQNSIYDSLLTQTRLKPYLDSIELVFDETGIHINYDKMNAMLLANSTGDNLKNGLDDFKDLKLIAENGLLDWDSKKIFISIGELNHFDENFISYSKNASIDIFNLIAGGDLDNQINGSVKADLIIGYVGNDNLSGGNGNDYLVGGTDNDTLNGSDGDDSLNGSTGNDSLIGGKGNDIYTFMTGDGSDTLSDYDFTTDNSDVVQLSDVKSTELRALERVGSSLVLRYGTTDQLTIINFFSSTAYGIEQFQFSDGVVWDGAVIKATVITNGDSNNNTITGYSDGSNRIYGLDGNDTLNGGALDDTIDGGSGRDNLTGNNGNDYLVGGADNDTLNGSDGDDLLVGDAGNDLLNGGNGNDHLMGGADNDTLNGNDGDDLLVGDIGNDLFDGGNGNDHLMGGADNDTLNGGNDDDALVGDAGNDVLNGGNGNDYLEGGSDNDTLNGSDGDDSLNGSTGNDSLIGGKGNDIYTFMTGDGSDTLSDYDFTTDNSDVVQLSDVKSTELRALERVGSSLVLRYGTTDQLTISNYFSSTAYGIEQFQFSDGVVWDGAVIKATVITNGDSNNNTITGYSDGTNRIYGLDGNDTLNGGALDDTIDGGNGRDNLTGNSGNDYLLGGADNDTLNGSDGDDMLVGDVGNDSLNGGKGNDVYSFVMDNGADTISDYDTTVGNGDVLQLQDIVADQLWFTKSGNNLEISVIGRTDKVTVQNWYSSNAYHVEEFKTSDGKTLLDSQVANLVSAMASMTPPAAGQTTLPQNYQDQLSAVLAANWK